MGLFGGTHGKTNMAEFSAEYVLQVAGCRLKFNYNWKTAGT